MHLLFINLLTDSLPAIAIGMEPADDKLLEEKPRDPKVGILTKDFMITLLCEGALIAVATMTAFHFGLQTSAEMASTMAFATLTLARLFHGFNCRGEQSILKLGLGSNKYSLLAFLGGVCLLALVLFVPFLNGVFSVVGLSTIALLQIIVLAFIPTLVIQVVKLVKISSYQNSLK